MLGFNYLKTLPEKIKSWKKFKNSNLHPTFKSTGKIPSETYIKYPPHSTFDGKKVLNLGCGKSTYTASNVINLDAIEGVGVNLVWDLSRLPLPLSTESVDLIIANHVLEHIPNWWDLFKDLSRVLKPGGLLEIWIPPVSSDSAFTYRDHINRIGMLSFAGTGSFKEAGTNLVVEADNKSQGYASQLLLIKYAKRPYMKWWLHFASDELLNWFTTHLNNTVTEECFVFRKSNVH